MKELIEVKGGLIGEDEVNTVDARELWEFLGSNTQFSMWIQRRIEKYEFEEDFDFTTITNFAYSPPRIEYFISLDMARELSMVERTERGKQARLYFIECERKLKEVKASLPDFTNPAEAAEAWAVEYREKQKAITERDEAVRTKAQISRKREATAMGTASAYKKKYEKLKSETQFKDEALDYLPVKGISRLKKVFNLKKPGAYARIGAALTELSKDMGYEIQKIPDPKWDKGVNAYHKDVIEDFDKDTFYWFPKLRKYAKR